MYWVVAIIGLAVLMVVHEAGHFFAARRYGMRVTRFSVGFGPPFFKIQPKDGFFWFNAFGDRIRIKLGKHDPEKHGETIYQVAMIPFLAYVQIAGMNPLEEQDPNDKGTYPNARLWARIVTIAGGPVANYLFASVFFFAAVYFDGNLVQGTQFNVVDGKPAQAAGMKNGDRVLSVDGVATKEWEDIPRLVGKKAGVAVKVKVQRSDGKIEELELIPDNDKGVGRIGIQMTGDPIKVKVGAGQAAILAVEKPTIVVRNMVLMLSEWFHGRVEGKLGSSVAMVKEMKKAAEVGWAEFVIFLGGLSAYLAVFNLLPLPALDGGRLMFLGYEAVTRRRPNPTMEAQIHAIGVVMLLGLMVYVTFANDLGLGSK